jgi:DNA-binding transcriptional ArsR family regulator
MTNEDADGTLAPGDAAAGGTGGARGVREITDARTLRALAHPVRVALIEELLITGPMTATEAAERIGESPTTCSFHLRQLARYGFVEEAGGGKGRARPWRMTSIGMSFTSNPENLELQLATNAVMHIFRERQFARYQAWLDSRSGYPARWRQAAGDSTYLFYLTADELEALNDELSRILLPRFVERMADPASRPAGSVPVEMSVLSYPIAVPPAGAEGGAAPGGGGAPDGGTPGVPS